MSNLLNELSVTMKEISKAETRLAELESKESDLSSKILLNKEATKALLEAGVIVGAELLRYHSTPKCFTLSDAPVFAHDINFDEPRDEPKNPFKVGDWVCMFDDETIASKVSYVNGDQIETENEMWSGHYECFNKVGYNEHEIESKNPFKVGSEVHAYGDSTKVLKVSGIHGDRVAVEGLPWRLKFDSVTKIS